MGDGRGVDTAPVIVDEDIGEVLDDAGVLGVEEQGVEKGRDEGWGGAVREDMRDDGGGGEGVVRVC